MPTGPRKREGKRKGAAGHESRSPDPILLAAARSLADGREPDWDALAAQEPRLAGRLQWMRLIRSVADACAQPLEIPPAEAVPPPDGPQPAQAGSAAAGLPFDWGPLRVLSRLGSGSFGEVFRAFDTVLHREVALKLRRFAGEAEEAAFEEHLEEARRLARVRHPNVLTVHGVEVHDRRAGMWTDFIRGETLEERLAREGPLPAAEVARIGIDLCAALAAVHDAGLIHGDVKTSNAMRDPDGRTILMDFGAGTATGRERVFPDGSPQGTPIVMAPELLQGTAPASHASDLYALGCLHYRLATGRHPVAASSWAELIDKHRRGEILPVRELRPDLPPSLARAIDRCLARDPADRPRSARELAAHFRVAAGDAGGVADDERGAPATESDGAGRPAANAPGNLPSFPTRLIGRREEILEMRRLLLEPGLVTLTGSAGCGKTRLAHRAAEEAAGWLPDGVWWVDLAPLQDPYLVAETAASAVGAPESKQRDALQQVLEFARGKTLLLVLDNCEHVLGGVRELLAGLLPAGTETRLRILATSREPLGHPGERTMRVRSLSVPPLPPARSGEREGLEILDAEAVRLFVDRTCRQRPGFAVTPEIAPAIARIVRRLDGIPLAIELAAARTSALTPEQIADHLDESFRLLSVRDAAVLPRQQTLLASIDWSYRLLSPPEQLCLARSAVFAGGWTLDAARAVCADEGGAGEEEKSSEGGTIGGEPVLGLLESLVRRSIAQFDSEASPPRYRMPEMVRAFALDRLREAGEEARGRDRHLAWFLRFAREADARMVGPVEPQAMAAIEAETDDFRAAIAWASRAGGGSGQAPRLEAGIRLCLSLRRYWFRSESFREGHRHFSEMLASAAGSPPELRGRAMVGASSLLWPTGDLDGAWKLGGEALALLRPTGEGDSIAQALNLLGYLADLRGDVEGSRALLTESFALHEAAGQLHAMATLACNLGVLEARFGNHTEAVPHYERAIAILREIGDDANQAVTSRNLSYSLLQLGEASRARRLAQEGVAVLRRTGQRRQLAASLSALAEIALAGGAVDEARLHAVEALHLAREAAEQVTLLAVLTTLGAVDHRSGEHARAARLLGAAEAQHEAMGLPIGEGERAIWDDRVRELRDALGADRFVSLWAAGRAMPLEEALRLAEGSAGGATGG